MIKKTLVLLFLLFFLTACAKKEEVKVDFKGPTSGPDPVKLQPTFGPNNPIPDRGSNGGPNSEPNSG